MIKKYLVKNFNWEIKITEVEAEKESEKSLWFKTSRGNLNCVRKRTVDYYNYFDTWEDAYDYLLKKHENITKRSKEIYENNRSLLGQVKKLKKEASQNKGVNSNENSKS